jgi:hypothetical protein
MGAPSLTVERPGTRTLGLYRRLFRPMPDTAEIWRITP